MHAADTNLLVRLLTRDDAIQLTKAEAFIRDGAWVSQLVLMETTWVLSSAYDVPTDKLALAVTMLLRHDRLVLERPDVVMRALESFEKIPSVGFSDHLILAVASAAGHGPLGTFDQKLGRLNGVDKL